MLILLQILLLSCSISVIVLNEKQFKTASLSLLVHSSSFGLNYRRSQIAFYLMSILTCIPGFFIPIKVKGEFRVLYGYLFLGCVHFALLVVNGSLHYTLCSDSAEVFNNLNASQLFTIQGIYYDGNDVIDVIQRNEKCCGVDGPIFWSKYTAWANLDLTQFNYKVPKSCCNKKHCSLASKKFNELTVHKKGCRQYLIQEFETLFRYNWKFPLGMSITQLIIVLLCIIIIKLQKSGYIEEEKEDENEKKPMLFWKRLGRKRKERKTRKPWFWFFKSDDEDEEGGGGDGVKKVDQDRFKRTKEERRKKPRKDPRSKFKGQPQKYKEDSTRDKDIIDDNGYQRPSRHSSFTRKSTISDQTTEGLLSSYQPPSPPHFSQHSRRPPDHQLGTSAKPIFRGQHDEIYDRDEKYEKESTGGRRARSERLLDNLTEEREFRERQNIDLRKGAVLKENNLQSLKRADDYSARTVEGFLEPTSGIENELDRKKDLDFALSKVDNYELSLRKKRLEALRRRRKQEMKKLARLSKEEEIEKEKLRALKREVISEYLSK